MPIINATDFLNNLINANERRVSPQSLENKETKELYETVQSCLKTLINDKDTVDKLQLFINTNTMFQGHEYSQMEYSLSKWFLQRDEDTLSGILSLVEGQLTNDQMKELIKSRLLKVSVTQLHRWFQSYVGRPRGSYNNSFNNSARYTKEVYSPAFLLKYLSLSNEAASALLDICDKLYQLSESNIRGKIYHTGIPSEIFSLFLYETEENLIYFVNCLRFCEHKPKVDNVKSFVKEMLDEKLINMQAQKLLNDLKHNPQLFQEKTSLQTIREYNKAKFKSLGAPLFGQILVFVLNSDYLGTLDKFSPEELNVILSSAIEAKNFKLAMQTITQLTSNTNTPHQIYTDNLYKAYRSQNVEVLKELVKAGGKIDDSQIIQTIFIEADVSMPFDERLDILMSHSSHLHYHLRGVLQNNTSIIRVELLCKHGALEQWKKAMESDDEACMESPIALAVSNDCSKEIINILRQFDPACKYNKSTTVTYQQIVNANNNNTALKDSQSSMDTKYSL